MAGNDSPTGIRYILYSYGIARPRLRRGAEQTKLTRRMPWLASERARLTLPPGRRPSGTSKHSSGRLISRRGAMCVRIAISNHSIRRAAGRSFSSAQLGSALASSTNTANSPQTRTATTYNAMIGGWGAGPSPRDNNSEGFFPE